MAETTPRSINERSKTMSCTFCDTRRKFGMQCLSSIANKRACEGSKQKNAQREEALEGEGGKKYIRQKNSPQTKAHGSRKDYNNVKKKLVEKGL